MSSVQRHFCIVILAVHARLCTVHSYIATLHHGRDLMENFVQISVTQSTCGKLVRCVKTCIVLSSLNCHLSFIIVSPQHRAYYEIVLFLKKTSHVQCELNFFSFKILSPQQDNIVYLKVPNLSDTLHLVILAKLDLAGKKPTSLSLVYAP